MEKINSVNSAAELNIENSGVLGITNLTDTPVKWMEDKLLNAINIFQDESHTDISDHIDSIFASFSVMVNEGLKVTLPEDLQYYVDNLLVNYDFFAFVAEYEYDLK